MEPKKISFGFSKTKKPSLISNIKPVNKEENKVELIKCLEGHKIKLVEEKPEEAPLVIPMRESHKTSAALASLMKRRAVLLGEEDSTQKDPEEVDSNASAISNGKPENLEQRAARELLADLKANDNDAESSSLVLPILKPDELPLDGAKESSIDDYEAIPIQQFGMAMLRGMGFVEPPKAKTKSGEDDAPFVRPKGMGLGADKALKAKALLVQPEANEVLEIKKQAYVRILGGKHKDLYGQIEGFDDHASRIIVKLAIGGAKEAFNEFLCQPVSRKEYAQYGKCINTAKYEEYKKLENEHGQIVIKKEQQEEDNCPLKREDDRKEIKVKREKYKDSNGSNNRDGMYFHDADRCDPRPKESTSRRHDNEDERLRYSRYAEEEQRNSSCNSTDRNRHFSSIKLDKRRSRSRNPDCRNYKDYKAQSTSSKGRRQLSPDPEQPQSTDETSDSDSSDSAYERKHKKKSKSRNKSKSSSEKKSKTSKKSSKKHSKARHKHYSSSSSDTSDSDTASSSEDERHKRSHKKKTKKSKKPRSRTRSRSRARK